MFNFIILPFDSIPVWYWIVSAVFAVVMICWIAWGTRH